MKEILQDFLVFTKSGLYCSYGDFFIDAKVPVNCVLVSHAHGDHTVAGCHTVFCTSPTQFFMQTRYGKKGGSVYKTFEFHQQFKINKISITFISAGHMLGSAQILMEYLGVKYLYTGDYKLQHDSTCDPFEFVIADVLITESTFANPETIHPDPVREVLKLNEVKHPIMLGAYALGKAQRLTMLINKHCNQKRILLHHSILKFHRIYEQFGCNSWKYELYDRKIMKHTPEDVIYIVPPITFNSYIKANNVVRVFASGWKRLHKRNQIEMLISDHVDWNDIICTVDQVKPTEIWTLHGDGEPLKLLYAGNIVVKLL